MYYRKKGEIFLVIMLLRKKPSVILCYEALFRNLKERYRTNRKLIEDYNRFNAGYYGEKEVDYNLSIYPHKDFFIFHNIRLKNHNNSFQIDTLILSKNFICILEIKNLAGELEYDAELNQLIQKNGDKITAIKDPVLQAETQKMHLKAWLQRLGITIPIETLVVISNPSTIFRIKQNDPGIYKKIIRTESLHLHLDEINKKYTKNILNKSQIKMISDSIITNNNPHHPDLIRRYNIQDHHLIKGVSCPSCAYYPMIRLYKKWSCPKCSTTEHSAHERIILDYFLLYNNTITNKQCRDLLQIESPKSIYVILKSMNLKYTGKNSARKYLAPYVNDFPQNSDFPGKFKSIFD
ncbi:nuclease-related domain-containing protein [Lentibacillus sp. Marseille-P4043]|uniref:nuclease-related domain-containing protein n=1 Tax=Lentibacillus sp. Marseille-P4043 TaxID=2040293 RepID=UPI001F157F1B|nr:nuclease-related domain-containing protein [Lentibacillus sp. Marseille-P4043]